MKPGENCQTCNYFAALMRQCRVHAPTALPVPQSDGKIAAMGMWPATDKDQWCGEWKGGSSPFGNAA